MKLGPLIISALAIVDNTLAREGTPQADTCQLLQPNTPVNIKVQFTIGNNNTAAANNFTANRSYPANFYYIDDGQNTFNSTWGFTVIDDTNFSQHYNWTLRATNETHQRCLAEVVNAYPPCSFITLDATDGKFYPDSRSPFTITCPPTGMTIAGFYPHSVTSLPPLHPTTLQPKTTKPGTTAAATKKSNESSILIIALTVIFVLAAIIYLIRLCANNTTEDDKSAYNALDDLAADDEKTDDDQLQTKQRRTMRPSESTRRVTYTTAAPSATSGDNDDELTARRRSLRPGTRGTTRTDK